MFMSLARVPPFQVSYFLTIPRPPLPTKIDCTLFFLIGPYPRRDALYFTFRMGDPVRQRGICLYTLIVTAPRRGYPSSF